MGVPPVKNGPHPFLFFDDRPKAVLQTKSYYVCSGNVVWGWRRR